MSGIDRGTSKSGGNKEPKLLKIIMAVLIVTILFASSLSLLSNPSSEIPPAPVPARISYTSHSTIFINGDAQFIAPNGVTAGTGIASDPYVISGWEINSAGFLVGINIGNTTAHFVIRDCLVYDAGQLDILLDNVTNGRLLRDECTSVQVGYGIYLRQSNHCLIENVNSSANSNHGLYFYYSDNNTVRNNTFSDSVSGGNGILLSYSNYNHLENNSCLRNQENGIWLCTSSNDNTLINNDCSSNNGGGIYLELSSDNTLINNTCNSNNWDGIGLQSSSNNTVRNNNCSDNSAGIWLHSSNDNTLKNNNCSSNYWDGIMLYSSTDNTLINNTCNSNYWDEGIWLYLSSNNNTLINNTCNSNYWDGIGLESSSYNTLTNNYCSDNADDGIWIWSSSNNTLTDNTCQNNEDNGIHLNSSCNNNSLRNNNCSSNNNDGISLWSSSNNTISNNICNWNHHYLGIVLNSSSNNNIISNNTCSNNGGEGIYLVLSNGNTVTNNNCSNNDYNSIEIDYSNNNIISNNNCSSNGWEGIYLVISSDGNTISNNNCSNNRYGIYIFSGSNNNKIWNNTFIGNNGAGSVYDPSHIQARDDGTNNWWNTSGSPHGYGNYWFDWTTPDIVAPWWIVDNPYNISGSAGAKDYYPLSSPPENIAPITTAASTGTIGTNGWFRSNVSVSLSATDAGSGVNATFYRIGTSGSWLGYSSPFVLSSDGNHTVQFYSMDNADNIESVNTITVKIDKTGPTLSINQTAGFEVTVDYAVISWISADATTGIDHFEVSIDGGAFVSVGMAMLHNFSGLADGMHNVTVKAIDAAGNEVNQTIQFAVDTSVSAGTSGNLMLYIAIIAIIVAIITVALVIMMRKKNSPPKRPEEMKTEPPTPPAA